VSFANADGGHIIYGMKEESGVPTILNGLTIDDVDAEKLRIESSIRDGIDPRIPGIQTNAVRLRESTTTIVLRIPKSWISPHMVKFKGASRFFSRASNGKFQLDVHQIRSAFLMRENTADRIRDFHADRISRIIGGRAVFPLPEVAKVVLHIIPVTAFDPAFAIDIKQIRHINQTDLVNICRLPSGYLSDGRFNLDGFVRFRLKSNLPIAYGYIQLFRNGVMEMVDAEFLVRLEGKLCFDIALFESEFINCLPSYISVLDRMGVSPPVYVLLVLSSVRDYEAYAGNRSHRLEKRAIDREMLLMPEVLIENFTCDFGRELRPAFDALCQAAGWEGSPNYDETGTWKCR
jgi:hypothetical protein